MSSPASWPKDGPHRGRRSVTGARQCSPRSTSSAPIHGPLTGVISDVGRFADPCLGHTGLYEDDGAPRPSMYFRRVYEAAAAALAFIAAYCCGSVSRV